MDTMLQCYSIHDSISFVACMQSQMLVLKQESENEAKLVLVLMVFRSCLPLKGHEGQI